MDKGLFLLKIVLIVYRFAARVSKLQMMDVAPIANVSSKNAFSLPSPPRRKPSCRPTPRIRISETLGPCHPNVAGDQSIHNRGSRPSMVHTDSLWVLPCLTTPITHHHRTATQCHHQALIKGPPYTMTEVPHSLPMLKIK